MRLRSALLTALFYIGFSISFLAVEANPIPTTEATQEVVDIYPNPFVDRFTVTYRGPVPAQTCKIYSIIGSEVATARFNEEGIANVVITDPINGIYFCNIYSAGGLLSSQRIICSK